MFLVNAIKVAAVCVELMKRLDDPAYGLDEGGCIDCDGCRVSMGQMFRHGSFSTRRTNVGILCRANVK